ncbi:MAG: hypothetical protein JST73_09420 [Actinobacteria bacterium]|nr:hypothetical protein [Actinomycetota bacterium]
MNVEVLRSRSVQVAIAVIAAVCLTICVISDSATVRGLVIGSGFGAVNFIVGIRSLEILLAHPGAEVAAFISSGLAARIMVLMTMFVVVASTSAISPTAFGLTFLAAVVGYFAVEVTMITRSQVRHSA